MLYHTPNTQRIDPQPNSEKKERKKKRRGPHASLRSHINFQNRVENPVGSHRMISLGPGALVRAGPEQNGIGLKSSGLGLWMS